MRNASVEWMARVAARNEIETAKATRGLRAVPLSAGARPALADGAASAGRENKRTTTR